MYKTFIFNCIKSPKRNHPTRGAYLKPPKDTLGMGGGVEAQTDHCFIINFFQAPGQPPLLGSFSLPSTPSKLLSASVTAFHPLTVSADTQCLPHVLFPFQNLVNHTFMPVLLSSNVSFCADAPPRRLLSQDLGALVL